MSKKPKARFVTGTSPVGKVAITTTMVTLTFTFLYPLFYMLMNTFKDKYEYFQSTFAFPKALDWTNYQVMLVDFKIMRYFANTMIITGSAMALVLILSTFASYAFAKINFKGRTVAYLFVISTLFMPGQATLIPTYVLFSKYGLINSYWSVILSGVVGGVPAAVMLMRSAFMGIPKDLLESAKIDGAGYFTTVFRVVLPVSMATISIVLINNFIGNWNSFLAPMLYLTEQSKQTIMVALSNLVSRNGSLPTRQLTGILLSVIPTIILYLFLQRYMVKGVMVGSLKG